MDKESDPESLDLQPHRGSFCVCPLCCDGPCQRDLSQGISPLVVKAGQWCKMYDSKVTRCDVTSVLRDPAYVLLDTQQTDLKKDSIHVRSAG